MAISPQRLTIYLYSAHRAVIFAIAQLSCSMIHPSDGQTDRQTDGRAIAYSALSIIICYILSRARNKMVISREDRMLIKVLHQEKRYGSKKLLAEFPKKAFELIPTVFIVLETYIFSVSSKR